MDNVNLKSVSTAANSSVNKLNQAASENKNQELNSIFNNKQDNENVKTKSGSIEKLTKSANEISELNSILNSISSDESFSLDDIEKSKFYVQNASSLAESAGLSSNLSATFGDITSKINTLANASASSADNSDSEASMNQVPYEKLSPEAKAAFDDMKARNDARQQAIDNGDGKETELPDGSKQIDVTYTYNGVTYTEKEVVDSSGTTTYRKVVDSNGNAQMGFMYVEPTTGERLWQSNTGNIVEGQLMWHIPYRLPIPMDHPELMGKFNFVPQQYWPKDM